MILAEPNNLTMLVRLLVLVAALVVVVLWVRHAAAKYNRKRGRHEDAWVWWLAVPVALLWFKACSDAAR